MIMVARIQVAGATGELIPKNTSFGILKPGHFLGRFEVTPAPSLTVPPPSGLKITPKRQ